MQGNQHRWLALFALAVLALAMLACGGFQLRGSATATPRPTREPPTAQPATRAPEPSPTAEVVQATAAPTPSPTPASGGTLAPGTTARATSVVNVRSEARASGRLLGTVASGDVVTVRDGPVNADNYSWYQIDNGKGLTGWAASGPANAPWLVVAGAAPAGAAAATQPPSGPRLVNRAPKKGDLVQVTTQAGLLLTVRAEPGKNAETVARAKPGAQFKVIDGPQEKDGITWWQIEGEQYKGWAAEGDAETRGLTPVE